MQIQATSFLSEPQVEQLRELWDCEYPTQIQHKTAASLSYYLSGLGDLKHLLLLDEQEQIQGWYFEFTREGDQWFGMLLNRGVQGRGYGTRLLDRAKETATILNGWVADQDHYHKQDGSPYQSPLQFYVKNGFEVLADKRFETSVLSTVQIRWQMAR